MDRRIDHLLEASGTGNESWEPGREGETVIVPLAAIAPDDVGRAVAAQAPERMWRWTVTVDGTCHRKTTTLTDRRRDAILSATRFIEAAKRIVRAEHTRMDAVIAHAPADRSPSDDAGGRFVLALELRRGDPAAVGRVYERIAAEAWTIGRLGATTFVFTPSEHNPAVVYEDRATAGASYPMMSYTRPVAPAMSVAAEQPALQRARVG
jgi:hypothetical protein